jgi:phosphoribosylformylglycinamidine synthase
MVVHHQGREIADMPLGPLADGAPEYDRPHVPTPKADDFNYAWLDGAPDTLSALKKLMGSSEVASRRWVYEQYDSMVMGDTVAGPSGDAALVRVHGTNKGLAMSTDVNPRYCFADPVEGGKQAVAEAYRNICAIGAKPLAITNCLNFGNPERPEIMGQFVGCLEGMGDAGKTLDFPIVSGNVSLYNETNGTGILPTPAIGGVGLIQDLDKAVGNSFTQDGQIIYLLGETNGHLGASLYQRDVLDNHQIVGPPRVDLAQEKAHGSFVRDAIDQGLIAAAHDLSDGGLLVALAEMSLGHGIGAQIEPDGDTGFWFGEDQARYLMSVAPEKADAFEALAKDLPLKRLGKTAGHTLTFGSSLSISVAELNEIYEGWFPALMSS